MKYAGFTKQERNFVTLMRVLSVFFIGAAVMFAFLPEILLNYLNDIGKVFIGWQSPPVIKGSGLWRAHSIVLQLILAYACLTAQASSLRNAGHARIVLMACGLSAALSAAMIFIEGPQFYLAVAATLGALIFLITLWMYSGASRSRSQRYES